MVKVKRVLFLAGILALALVLLSSCARLFWHDDAQSGWYIQLNVGYPGAKAIGVGEYDVTGLSIAVYDPGDQLLDTIEWDAGEGSMSYMVQVSQAGTHRIEVTHFGENNGEPVEATESAEFDIQPMVITVINVTPGAVGVIEVEPGEQDGLTDGELYECAMAAMMAFWGAMGPLTQGSDEFPPGITVDDSNFDEELLGGTILLTFTNYTLPDSDVTVNGDIIMDVTFPPGLLGDLELILTGSLILSSLPCETVEFDLTLTAFMEDAPYWATLEWDGSIAVNGQEADVDQVMSDWKAMVVDATTTDGEPLIGERLLYAVTLDGQISSANEWSDTDFADMDWGLWHPPTPPYINARVWAKNDDTWLYLLYRVEWPSTDTDAFDAGQIARYWGNYGPPWDYSDLGLFAFGGGFWDAYGWDEYQFYSDTDAGGENNVEGAATHDGTYYWFEFRKELNSGDGYDWTLGPGDTYRLLAGLWDNSIGAEYHANVLLKVY
jgi:hypothetical protein